MAHPCREMLESPALSVVRHALAQTAADRTVWIALSGGLDSVMLVRLVAKAADGCPRRIRLVHVHHGLQAANDIFEQLARRVASRLGLPLSVCHLVLSTAALKARGLEAAAREGRLTALADCLRDGDSLWLAQHRDDQAETLLLNALRGSGGRGLAAMPHERTLMLGSRGVARLVRPLLDISRCELVGLAREQGMSVAYDWCEDPSNADQHFDRNYLRHVVVPKLEERWPQSSASLSRSALQLQEEQQLLDELAAELLADLQEGVSAEGACAEGEVLRLSLARMAALSEARQRLVLRHLCQVHGWPVPPRGRLMSLQQLIATPPTSVGEVRWTNARYVVVVRVWRGQLWWQVNGVGVEDDEDAGAICALDVQAYLAWQTLGRDPEAVLITPRQPGDMLRVPGRGRRDLKRLLQEADIPPWQRHLLRVARQVTDSEQCEGRIKEVGEEQVEGLWHPSCGWWLLASNV
ncbi:tRNA lysidine(34) synthetase TilS [Cobetia crustatorum]|uniref:tRNA(Ile)-lysidine synthase n=1 Tax=Cobetia crustatorum TaxID=553385 RepID=A0A558HGV1_9GAMM|nr:tRNA lysidine(34) synthetase TilS [Cobetia crustatorum]TVU68359.1 tRNA lysidine(34) synthetase TilS [Cobetia crustatorum]